MPAPTRSAGVVGAGRAFVSAADSGVSTMNPPPFTTRGGAGVSKYTSAPTATAATMRIDAPVCHAWPRPTAPGTGADAGADVGKDVIQCWAVGLLSSTAEVSTGSDSSAGSGAWVGVVAASQGARPRRDCRSGNRLASQLQQDDADTPFGDPQCGHGARCESTGGVSVAQSSKAGSGGGKSLAGAGSPARGAACNAGSPVSSLKTKLMAQSPSPAHSAFGVLDNPP